MFEFSEYYEHLEEVETCNKSIKKFLTFLNLFELVQAQKGIYWAVLDLFWIMLTIYFA